MIKTSDLMAGDYILVKGSPRKVIEVKRGLVGYYPTKDSQKVSFSYPHVCEPMMITNGWLLEHWFMFHLPQPGFDYYYRDKYLTIWLNPSGTMAVRLKIRSALGGTKLMAEGLQPTASCLHQILKAIGEEEIFTHIMERYESTIQKD